MAAVTIVDRRRLRHVTYSAVAGRRSCRRRRAPRRENLVTSVIDVDVVTRCRRRK